MKTLLKTSIVAVALIAPALSVQAAPTFGGGLNSMFFNNFENLYRTTSACNDGPVGACLPSGAGDPAGWQRVNPGVVGNVLAGDVFAGILNVQGIDNNGSQIYFSSPTNQFTGYFAQQVVDVNVSAGPHAGLNGDHIRLGNPTVDPFAVLAAGESMRLYVDTGVGATVFNSGSANPLFDTVPELIAIATDGTLWAGLGVGAPEPANGYAYTHTDLTLTGNASEPSSFIAMNLVTLGGAYNAGALALINDGNENEIGGMSGFPVTVPCSLAQILAGVIACTQLVATSEIEANPGVQTGSPFFFRSNDPAELFQVPEPGTLSLLALTLIGLGMVGRRRRTA